MTEPRYDIVVAGGGPGGLSAADAAARHGKRVVVFEKEWEIGYPVRTSGGTWIEDMESLGVPSRFYNPLKRVIFASPSESAEFSYDKSVACVLDVRGLFQYLALKAAKAGAEIRLGTSVNRIEHKEDHQELIATRLSAEQRVQASMCIDATGFPATLARQRGLLTKWKKFGAGAEYEAYCENLEKDTAYLIVGNQVAPSGYAWVFPIDSERARLGVGIMRPERTESPVMLLDRFVGKRPAVLKGLGKITPLEFHAGNVPGQGYLPRAVADGLIVVGDAAGQAGPLVGEGIRFAMRLGTIGGDVASDAVEHNNCTAKFLSIYEQKWRKLIGGSHKLALRIQDRMVDFSDPKWDEGVRKMRQLKPDEFAKLLKQDFRFRTIMGILAAHPMLSASTSIQILLKGFAGTEGEATADARLST